MNFAMTISLGQAITIGITIFSVFAGVVAWRQQTIAMAAKLDGLDISVGNRLDKLEKALEETSDALTTRVSQLETNLHSLELQITRDYVSRTMLADLKIDLTLSIEKVETTFREVLQSVSKSRTTRS